jgi:hypothetical protein
VWRAARFSAVIRLTVHPQPQSAIPRKNGSRRLSDAGHIALF